MKKIRPHKVDWAQIGRFLASADRKLASAHKILAFDEEACLQHRCHSRRHLCKKTLIGENRWGRQGKGKMLVSRGILPGIQVKVFTALKDGP